VRTPFGKRTFISALLSGFLNAVLIAASMTSAPEETPGSLTA